MTEWVGLLPDNVLGVELGDKPVIVFWGCKVIVLTDEEASRKGKLVERDCRSLSLAIDVHVSDRSIAITKVFFLVLDTLSVVDQVAPAVTGREVFEEDIVPIHVINFDVGVGDIANQSFAYTFEVVAQKLCRRLLEPSKVEKVVGTGFESYILDLSPVL